MLPSPVGCKLRVGILRGLVCLGIWRQQHWCTGWCHSCWIGRQSARHSIGCVADLSMYPSCIFTLDLSGLKSYRSCLVEASKRLPKWYGYHIHDIQNEIIVHPKFSSACQWDMRNRSLDTELLWGSGKRPSKITIAHLTPHVSLRRHQNVSFTHLQKILKIMCSHSFHLRAVISKALNGIISKRWYTMISTIYS